MVVENPDVGERWLDAPGIQLFEDHRKLPEVSADLRVVESTALRTCDLELRDHGQVADARDTRTIVENRSMRHMHAGLAGHDEIYPDLVAREPGAVNAQVSQPDVGFPGDPIDPKLRDDVVREPCLEARLVGNHVTARQGEDLPRGTELAVNVLLAHDNNCRR